MYTKHVALCNTASCLTFEQNWARKRKIWKKWFLYYYEVAEHCAHKKIVLERFIQKLNFWIIPHSYYLIYDQ